MSAFSYDIRYGGVMGFVAANGTAAFLSQALGALMVLWASSREKIIKWGALGISIACVYCVMFAFSRGAYLALLLLWLFVGFLRKRILLVYFGIFLVSWQVLVPTAVQQRVFMTVKDDGGLEESAADRQAMWTDAMQLIQENPVSGTGFHTYAFMGRVGNYRDTHNYYIKVMVETGLMGLALFLTMLFKMFRYGFRLSHKLKDSLHANLGLGFSLWILAQMVVSLFGDRWTYIEITGFTFVYLALMVRAEQIDDSAAEQETGQIAGEESLLGEFPTAAAAQ
jgi:O-antigen ligase